VVSTGVQVTQQLMGLARGGGEGVTDLDLGDTVRRLHPLLRAIVGPRFLLLLRLEPDLVVRATQADVQRILLNLVDNACHASSPGNTIRVEVSVGAERDTVNLAVVDQGVGIDEEVRPHIFEPLFTTRADKGGTGLGLSAVLSICERLGGRVEVDSEPRRGSTFRVVLPRVS
jgi:signal transduction histidine kinase